MDFSSFNIIAIAVASFAGFVTGALWFSPKTFFPLWWRALGKSTDEVPGKGTDMGAIFASLVGSMLIQAVILSGVINGLYENASIAQGVIAGIVIGVGISAMSSMGIVSLQVTVSWRGHSKQATTLQRLQSWVRSSPLSNRA